MEIVVLTVVLVGCALFILRKASKKFSGAGGDCGGCANAGDCGRSESGA